MTAKKLAAGVASKSCNDGLAPDDVMVRVGSVCIDRYEASIWDKRVGGKQITDAIPCSPNGQDCRGRSSPAPCAVSCRGRRSPGFNPRWRSPTRASACRRTPSGRWRPPVPPTGHPATCSPPWRSRPARAPAASPAMASTTWSETIGSGSPSGCRARPPAEAGPTAMAATTNAWVGRRPRVLRRAYPWWQLRHRRRPSTSEVRGRSRPGVSEPSFVDGVGFRGAR